jgi:ribonucleotide reductase alpha subunit
MLLYPSKNSMRQIKMIDHRQDDELALQNQESLKLNEKLDRIQFKRITSVTSEKYKGKVYDLKIDKEKNYQTLFGTVHNGGRRKGSACVYLDTWHPDIFEFLELRDNTGDPEKRAYNLNLANWIPDLFMKRVKEAVEEDRDVMWSLIDPNTAPDLPDLFGEAFEKRYLQLEADKKYVRQVSARDLFARMMRTLSETGNGWFCLKDASNIKCNSAVNNMMLHSSNLCLAPDTLIRAKINNEELDVTIEALTEKYQEGDDIKVLSFNESNQQFEWSDIANIGITSYDAEVIEIEIEPGNIIECTEDHLFLTKNRGWIRAIDLEESDILVRLNLETISNIIKIRRTGKRTAVYDMHVPGNHNFIANGVVVHNCTEILEPTSAGKYIWRESKEMDLTGQTRLEKYSKNRVVHYDADQDKFMILDGAETAVCNLGSIAIHRYIKDGKLDKVKLRKNVTLAVKFLDKVIDRNYYPTNEAAASNLRLRPVGLGLMGLQDFFFMLKIPFESEEAVNLSAEIQEEIYYQALKTSCELAHHLGKHSDFEYTHAAKGILQFDMWGVKPKDEKRWNELKEDIKKYGLRNSLLLAVAPTATLGSITGSTECIEPQISNLYKKETLSGEFIMTNKYLINDLKQLNLWNTDMLNLIKQNDGSVQNIATIPENIRKLYKTVWEIKQKWLIDHAAQRGAYIDQSQSLNLFMENPSIEKLSSMYFYLWSSGLKTSYYLRSRGATKINKTTVSANPAEPIANLETPETCEACT